MTHRVTFAAYNVWTDIASPYFLSTIVSWLAANPANNEVLTVALVPLSDANNTLAAIAAGTNDAYWQQLATNLLGTGYSDRIIVRLGWELNGNWYPWNAIASPATYASAYAHVVSLMRAIAPALRFEWNLSRTGSAISWGAAYPGNQYVDIISMDVYDAYNNGWNDIVGGAYGLAAFRAFAQENGKPEAYTEWSCDTSANGHGDNPIFATLMYCWMAVGNVSHHGYWNTAAGGPNAAIQGAGSGNVPRTARMYRTIFGRSPCTGCSQIPVMTQAGKLFPSKTIPENFAVVCDGSNYNVAVTQ